VKKNSAQWRAIEARLGREMTVWIATARSDGRPHLTPVWFIWLNEKIYIVIGADSQKIANLRRNQKVAVALPDTANVVIFEGEAHMADRAAADVLGDYFFNKYEWDFRHDDSANWRLIEITPEKLLSWNEGSG
jgi:F420H(2)-dependent biliverdin reductase